MINKGEGRKSMQRTRIEPNLGKIRITDRLFSHYVRLVSEQVIPYQWEALNDRLENTERSYCIRNFRLAAGLETGKRLGAVFSDTDAYKWLETLAYCLESGSGREYEPIADGLIELIAAAQCPDGYLNTYFSVSAAEKRWSNLTEGHELYCAGHLIEAAVAYYNATGKTALLTVAVRFADLICTEFSAPEDRRCPGHQEIELALMKLYHLTGREKYASLARHFIEVRGTAPNFLQETLRTLGPDRIYPDFADYDAAYAQSSCPPIEQRRAEGHAVRAMYMYSAMADLAEVFRDDVLRQACEALWCNITEKQMYLTGGLGASGHLERFTADYDLPNDRMYCESCASVGLMMFGKRMASLTGEARYFDAVERALYNTVLAGISADGRKYFYVNPLEVWPENCLPSTSMSHVKPVRQPWFACACCPPNIARTLAALGSYIYTQTADTFSINLLISSEAETVLNGTELHLTMKAAAVPSGTVRVTAETVGAVAVRLRVRIPAYLQYPQITMQGQAMPISVKNGYAVVTVPGNARQEFMITGEVRPRWTAANLNVRADIGKAALEYGPYVYCLEETDNGENLQTLFAEPESIPRPSAPASGLPGELPMLEVEGSRLTGGPAGLYGTLEFHSTPVVLRAIPYCLWCNRKPGEMTVWIKLHV